MKDNFKNIIYCILIDKKLYLKKNIILNLYER